MHNQVLILQAAWIYTESFIIGNTLSNLRKGFTIYDIGHCYVNYKTYFRNDQTLQWKSFKLKINTSHLFKHPDLHLSPLLSISGSEKMNLSFTFLLLPFFLILLLKTIAIRADSEEHPCAEVKCPTVHQHQYFGVRLCPCVHCTLSLGVHTNVMSIVSTRHTDIHVWTQ